ncbi:Endoribonuclease Dicer [Desmophyllum pertusum]|uniref:Endoribonuclease Dicer n=1 Tax=Desmophyllum pertusum TaxID=174260 RepID=A0A9W9ZLQ8_9CNID|nr:Endoribonuclease Dicer [Desmophyllum pertusum]
MFRGSRSSGNHPDSALVLQALTPTHSGDAFDLERLEMLGDAFLKLAVSLHLFCTYKDKDEGKLTLHKKNQISNLALYRAAAKKSLAGYIQKTPLARDVWCPTGSQFSDAPQDTNTTTGDQAMEAANETYRATDVEMEVDDAQQRGADDKTEESAAERARQKCNTQMIADKSVADSIEALIGAYLISCGYHGALQFMKFLALKVLPEDGASDDTDPFAVKNNPGVTPDFGLMSQMYQQREIRTTWCLD